MRDIEAPDEVEDEETLEEMTPKMAEGLVEDEDETETETETALTIRIAPEATARVDPVEDEDPAEAPGAETVVEIAAEAEAGVESIEAEVSARARARETDDTCTGGTKWRQTLDLLST